MSNGDLIRDPVSRRLRIFAFDPSLAAQYDLAGIGEITLAVPWERLGRSPVGAYIEVVDADPASGALYSTRWATTGATMPRSMAGRRTSTPTSAGWRLETTGGSSAL